MEKFFNLYKKVGCFAILLVVIGIFSILNPVYFSLQNGINIAKQVSVMLIMGVGMTLVILTGGIDLCQGSLISFTCVLSSKLVVEAGLPLLVAYLVCILVAAFVGFINGTLVARCNVPPLVITTGMSTVLSGIAYTLCQGIPVYGLPDSMKIIAQTNLLGVPVLAVIAVIILLIGSFLLRRTYLGRYLYAIGSNAEATKLAGINEKHIRTMAYTMSSFLVGIAGILMVARIGSGQPNAGLAYDTDVLSGCVLGGVSLSGGKGKISNAVLGILIIGCLSTGMTLAGTDEFSKKIVKGLVLMIAVVLDSLQNVKVKKRVQEKTA